MRGGFRARGGVNESLDVVAPGIAESPRGNGCRLAAAIRGVYFKPADVGRVKTFATDMRDLRVEFLTSRS